MIIACHQCGRSADLLAGHVNRARKAGNRLFCSRGCAGLARRKHKTKAQLVEEKRLYDAAYRARDPDKRKAAKAAYYQRTRNPEKERDRRKARMPLHVEYCRRPEYRAWKADYDRRYRAEREFGEFGEAFMLLQDVEREVSARMTKYEIYLANGTLNKRNNRRRAYENPLGL